MSQGDDDDDDAATTVAVRRTGNGASTEASLITAVPSSTAMASACRSADRRSRPNRDSNGADSEQPPGCRPRSAAPCRLSLVASILFFDFDTRSSLVYLSDPYVERDPYDLERLGTSASRMWTRVLEVVCR